MSEKVIYDTKGKRRISKKIGLGKTDENLLKQGEEEGEGYKGTPDLYPDYDIDFGEEFKKIDAEKMVGGGIARPEQPIKGVKPIQVKGRKFQGVF